MIEFGGRIRSEGGGDGGGGGFRRPRASERDAILNDNIVVIAKQHTFRKHLTSAPAAAAAARPCLHWSSCRGYFDGRVVGCFDAVFVARLGHAAA